MCSITNVVLRAKPVRIPGMSLPQSSSSPRQASRFQRHLIAIVGLLISAVSLYLVFRNTDWRVFWGGLANARLSFILLRYLILIVALLIQGLRWRVLTRGKLGVVDGFWLIGIGFLFNNILPVRLGEGIRLLLASRRQHMSLTVATATILVERLLDVATLLVLLGALLPVLNLPAWMITTAMLMGGAAVGGLAFLLVLQRHPVILSRIGLPLLSRLLGEQTADRILAPILDGVASIPDTKTFLAAFGLSLASWLISGVGAWMLMLALWDYPPPVGLGLLVTLSAGFGVAVPSAPGGIGPYEAAVVASLTFLNYGGDASRLFAVMLHLTALTLTDGLGAIGLIREGLNPFVILRDARALQNHPK